MREEPVPHFPCLAHPSTHLLLGVGAAMMSFTVLKPLLSAVALVRMEEKLP